MSNSTWRRIRGWAGMILACTISSSFPDSGHAQPQRPTRPDKPNIIFILADDLGYGDIGSFGQAKIKTPNLDRMAAEGMRFTDSYAGSTVCAPSRASLLTGQHTGHVHIRGNSRDPAVSLRKQDTTVAEVLQRAGYRSGVIGKWGLGPEGSDGLPHKKGFEEWLGYLNHIDAHNYYPEYLWRSTPQGEERRILLNGNLEGKKGEYSHDLFTHAALNFLRINADRPFFLFLSYTIPHAHNHLTRETGNGMEVPTDQPYSDQDWPQPEKNKAAMITRMDADIGQIFARLRELGIDEQTLVLFTSDNGPHKEGGNDPAFFKSSGPLRGIKRDLYEGGIRVPTIARWPGKVKAGTVSDHVWAFWDFLPTAAELAGVRPPKGIDGISIVPTLVGNDLKQKKHEFLYWEFHERGFKQAVRMGEWKAVRLGLDKPLELYNLKSDIGEKENVADRHPEVVATIEDYLKTARTESEHWKVQRAAR